MQRLHESCRNHGGKEGWEGGGREGEVGGRWEEEGRGIRMNQGVLFHGERFVTAQLYAQAVGG